MHDRRDAFEAAGVGIAVLTREGRVIDANHALGRLLGRPAGDLDGQPCPLLEGLDAQRWAALVAGELESAGFEYRLKDARWLLVTVSATDEQLVGGVEGQRRDG